MALGLMASPAAAQEPEAEVLRVAQAVFDAMGRRDTGALGRLVHPMAVLMAMVEAGDSVVVRGSGRAEFLSQIASFRGTPVERIWNPEARVSGTVATIWAPYDFHIGTAFSHCGIDSFQLVRTAAGWQVSSIVYTVVRPVDRCPKSPLGDPR